MSTVLPLAFLAPEIIEAILAGTHPADLTATKLIRRIDLALYWERRSRNSASSEPRTPCQLDRP